MAKHTLKIGNTIASLKIETQTIKTFKEEHQEIISRKLIRGNPILCQAWCDPECLRKSLF